MDHFGRKGCLLWEVGADGFRDFKLVHLLSLGPVWPGSRPVHETDADRWVDLVRCAQLPFYEEARTAFQGKSAAKEYGGWNEAAPYLQENLQRLANAAGD